MWIRVKIRKWHILIAWKHTLFTSYFHVSCCWFVFVLDLLGICVSIHLYIFLSKLTHIWNLTHLSICKFFQKLPSLYEGWWTLHGSFLLKKTMLGNMTVFINRPLSSFKTDLLVCIVLFFVQLMLKSRLMYFLIWIQCSVI